MAGHSVAEWVDFAPAGDEDHERDSHAHVTSYECFSSNGAPIDGGVYDARLGTTDHAITCLTCVHGKKLCPGHRGHHVLRAGVTTPIGAAGEVRRWLRVICLRCGEPVVERDRYASVPAGRRLAAAAAVDT